MKTYTKVYLKAFNLTTADWIGCEVCEKEKATEIHHIIPRSKAPEMLNEITNIMAICRSCHDQFGSKVEFYDYLQEIHDRVIAEHQGKDK